MTKARGFELLVLKEEAKAKIENGECEDPRLAIDFAIDFAPHDGLAFLKAWRAGKWIFLRTNWTEWVPFLRRRFPQYFID